jgi:GDPmannose 4,6-dehydratase
MAFAGAGIAVEFRGSGADEVAVDTATGRTVMRINPRFLRPAEVELLIGDAGHARDKLGWQAGTSLEELCAMMVAADLRRCERGVSF